MNSRAGKIPVWAGQRGLNWIEIRIRDAGLARTRCLALCRQGHVVELEQMTAARFAAGP